MYYKSLDQNLNQPRIGFANADPSELANDVVFHISTKPKFSDQKHTDRKNKYDN